MHLTNSTAPMHRINDLHGYKQNNGLFQDLKSNEILRLLQCTVAISDANQYWLA